MQRLTIWEPVRMYLVECIYSRPSIIIEEHASMTCLCSEMSAIIHVPVVRSYADNLSLKFDKFKRQENICKMFVRQRRSNIKTKLGCAALFISSVIVLCFTNERIRMDFISRYAWSNAMIIINLSNTHQNISFNYETVYFYNGTTYDFYSLNELNNSTSPWEKFPLSNDSFAYRRTGLAFVDQIFITTTSNLTDRQENLKRLFRREQIDHYEWRLKWKQKECLNDQNRKEVIRKMNLRLPLLGKYFLPIDLLVQIIFDQNSRE